MIKKDEVHFMLDVEALSLEPNTVICTIGCCTFHPFIRVSQPDAIDDVIVDQFYRRVDWNVNDGHISTETLKWWFDKNRDEDARHELTAVVPPNNSPLVPLSAVVERLSHFINIKSTQCNHQKVYIWTTGNFDTDIIKYRFKQYNIKWPFHYRNICNVRDIYRTAKVKDPTFDSKEYMKKLTVGSIVAHRADSDCIIQAITLAEAYRIILG